MAPKCDLDDCSLNGYIEEMREDQKELTGKHDALLEAHGQVVTAQAVMVEKVDGWMKQIKDDKDDNEKEHNILFDRTRGIAYWKHIFMALGGLATILTIAYTILKLARLI